MATDQNKADRTTKALRQWIDASGNIPDDPADATGFRYVHLPTAKRLVPDLDPQDAPPADAVYEMPTMPDNVKTMLAIFGALTLAGNITSSETNPKSGGDPDCNPIGAIADRFNEISQGKWTGDRGDRGPRYDYKALAQAIMTVKKESDSNPYLARLEAKEKITVKDKAGKTVTMLYATYALNNKDVETEYHKLTGTSPITVSASDL